MSRETQLAVAIRTKEMEEVIGLWASKWPPKETSYDEAPQSPKSAFEAPSIFGWRIIVLKQSV
jgi:hypothetical protein